jgi:hypothetical protein
METNNKYLMEFSGMTLGSINSLPADLAMWHGIAQLPVLRVLRTWVTQTHVRKTAHNSRTDDK